jgi:hypothetical protein
MKPRSKVISKVLSPALRLWLRSQVDSIEDIQLHIGGRNREILSGYIPSVSLGGTHAVYQGLHIKEVRLTGENIRINIGQIIQGNPLQLLEPVACTGQISLEEADLNASLSSSLISNAFTDLLLMLIEKSGLSEPSTILEKYYVNWQSAILNANEFVIKGILVDIDGISQPILIRSSLALIDFRRLRLDPIHVEFMPHLFPINITELEVDLGDDVEIDELSLDAGKFFCCGRAIVRS